MTQPANKRLVTEAAQTVAIGEETSRAAAAEATKVPKWQATTAYTAGDVVMAPDGSIVKRLTSGTSGSSYSSANWQTVSTVSGTQANTELNSAIDVRVRSRVSNSYDLREWGAITSGSDHTSLLTSAIADLNGTPDMFGDVDELVLPRLGYSINLGAVTFNKGIRLTAKGYVTLAGALTFNAGDVEINGLKLLADPSLSIIRVISALGAASGGSCTSFKWKGGGGRNLPGLIRTQNVPIVEISGLDVTMPNDPTLTVTGMLFDDVDTKIVVKDNSLTGPVVGSQIGSITGIGFRGCYNINLDNNDVFNFYTSCVARESPTTTNIDRYCKNMVATRNRFWNPRKGLINPVGPVMDQSQGFYIQNMQGGQFAFNEVYNPEHTAYAFVKSSATMPVGWAAQPGCHDVIAVNNRALGGAATASDTTGAFAYLVGPAINCKINDNYADGPFTYGCQLGSVSITSYRNQVMRNTFDLARPESVRGVYVFNNVESIIAHNSGQLVDSDGGFAVKAVQVVSATAPGTIIGPNYFTVDGGVDFYTDQVASAVDWIRIQPPGRVVVKTSANTAVLTDGIILASGTWIQTLPAAALAGAGHKITIKNTGTGTITVSGGAGTIDGASTYAISGQNDSRDFICDGTNWSVI